MISRITTSGPEEQCHPDVWEHEHALPATQGSINQGGIGHNFHNEEEEDPDYNEFEEQSNDEEEHEDYNEFDDQEYEEEEYEGTQNEEDPSRNPMDQFMHLLRQNLNHHPPPPPPGPNTTGRNAFKAFKSLKTPEFQGSADPVEARAWLKKWKNHLKS
ncbi:hypothetical protein POM88_001089 [Heracleum sosnowskyi]|uniref:Uncharacterized protein n=1 Tax=Heracleum sosnowskyi TaxID=360622 RepID=A0AAD8JCA9_9APIA|nr:hypothetical protein POM88_001089 [Heracleum sosnowskyi]